jgi:hypothetical protein
MVYVLAELGERLGFWCKELQRLGHEVRVELEHRTVSRVGIDDEFALRKTPRQIVRVLLGTMRSLSPFATSTGC